MVWFELEVPRGPNYCRIIISAGCRGWDSNHSRSGDVTRTTPFLYYRLPKWMLNLLLSR